MADVHAEQYGGDKKLGAPNWPVSHFGGDCTPSSQDKDLSGQPSMWITATADCRIKVDTLGGQIGATANLFKGWNLVRLTKLYTAGSTLNGATLEYWY